MPVANSMNKARQCFEARGNAQLKPAGIPVGKICLRTAMFAREVETANSKPVSQSRSQQKVQPFRMQQ